MINKVTKFSVYPLLFVYVSLTNITGTYWLVIITMNVIPFYSLHLHLRLWWATYHYLSEL